MRVWGVLKNWEGREIHERKREREKQLRRSSVLNLSLLGKYLQEKRVHIESKILSLGPLGWPKKVFPIVGNSFPTSNK